MKTKMKPSSVIRTAILLGLGILFSSGCQKQQAGWKGKIETIDGVKVVHNFEPDAEQSFKSVEFIVDLSVGEIEGDENYMFNDPRDIDADNEGNIYVLDTRACTIKKYNPEGKYLRNIGRVGEGPGEFQRPRRLCISREGNIFVADWNTDKIHILNSEGKFERASHLASLDLISVTGNEELIAGYRHYEEENNKLKYFYKVGKYDPQKEEIHDFYTQKQLRTARVSDGTFTFEYPLFVRWDINSKDQIIIATANTYEMKVFTPDGSLLNKYILDVNPIPVTGEAERKISEILKRIRTGLGVDDPETRKIVEYYPVFNCISIDEKDRIWVERYDPYWRDKTRKEIIFDVFSAEGKFSFTTKIEMDIYPQLKFKNGYIYTLARDESGYRKALRLRMVEE